MTTRNVVRTAILDTIQWGIGAAIGVHETIIRQAEPRWEVLIFAGILMGVPALIGLLRLRPDTETRVSLPPPPSAPTVDTQSSSP